MTVNFDPVENAIGNLADSMTVADFDGDGSLDIALVNQLSDSVLVLLGDDNNSFAAPQSFTVGDSPRSVTVGDFNGDEKIDLITANSLSSDVSVLLGDGNGNFEAAQNFAVDNNPDSLIVGDFNGDGNSDIAAINLNSGKVSVLLNNPNPNNPPIANDDEFTTLENEAFQGGKVFVNNGRGVDSDPDSDTLTVIEVNGEANIGNQIILDSGAKLTLNSDGTFDYDPNGKFISLNEGETTTDSFEYTISDGKGGNDSAIVTFFIAGVDELENNPPIANDDEFTTLENEAFQGGKVFVNNGRGVDSDPDSDTLTVIEVNGEANIGNQIILDSGAKLTMNSDGTFDYDPNGKFISLNEGETTTDSFEYTISDGKGGNDSAIVNFTTVGVEEELESLPIDDSAINNFAVPDTGMGTDTLAGIQFLNLDDTLFAAGDSIFDKSNNSVSSS